MNRDAKISDARRVIRAAMGHFRNPCVLWSGGKDSMVLLHLLRMETLDWPVVCYREPWLPEKQGFVNRVIAEWNLEVWDYAPSAVSLCKGNGRIDILNTYKVGVAPDATMTLARGTEKPVEGEPWICGRTTFLGRPLGTFQFPWDAMFIGHKSVDVDPTSGQVPLQTDVMNKPGSSAAVYPLRHWTDGDVFAYIECFNVPYDESRYELGDDGQWRLLADKRRNPDYYATCLRCCDPEEGPFVMCPKLGLEIDNIAERLRWVQPRMDYCGLRTSTKGGENHDEETNEERRRRQEVLTPGEEDACAA